MAAEYQTDEERTRAREKAKQEKLSANQRISLLQKQHEEQTAKLRSVRKEAAEKAEKAKQETLAANQKSATFPMIGAHYVVAPGTPIVASIAAVVDGRIGSKEDVASWVTAAVGLISAVGAALTGNPTGALVGATVMGGGLASTTSRRAREWGAKMRAEAAHGPAVG